VKPGGIIAFITSRYTLDKVNPRVRRHITEHAELLAAARLPESAFRKNAGTEVVTDVLILRRKASPSGVDNKLAWIETGALPNAEEYRVPVNRLYIERPEMMLGVPGCSRGMYGDHEFSLKPDGRDLAAALRESLTSQLPSQAIAATTANQSTSAPLPIEDAQEKEKAGAIDLDRLSGISRQRASLLLDLYSAAKQVIKLQILDAEDEKMAEAQRELNPLYLRFTARYGPINAKQNLKDLDRRSPLVPFLRALEEPAGKGSWKRAAIFHSRTIRPRKDFAQISSPKDALFFCLNECGRVDLNRIAAMTGQTKEEAAGALRGLIFETTSGGWATADEHLSGNVVEKLKEAQAAAALNYRFQENVEALTAVQPAPLGTEEIAARLGSGWIPPSVVRQFIREIIPQFDGQVKYVESLGTWKIEGSNYWARYSIEATQTWGTARMNAIDLLDDGLNLRTPMIYDEIDEPAGARRVLNDTETVAAQAKLAEIKMKFVEWLWSSESRARELCAIYNERYNCLRERRYDGSHLQLPGMNSSITLRPHHLDGIARILQSKATLLGHCVGAGKTFLMVAAAMELKRLGLRSQDDGRRPESPAREVGSWGASPLPPDVHNARIGDGLIFGDERHVLQSGRSDDGCVEDIPVEPVATRFGDDPLIERDTFKARMREQRVGPVRVGGVESDGAFQFKARYFPERDSRNVDVCLVSFRGLKCSQSAPRKFFVKPGGVPQQGMGIGDVNRHGYSRSSAARRASVCFSSSASFREAASRSPTRMMEPANFQSRRNRSRAANSDSLCARAGSGDTRPSSQRQTVFAVTPINSPNSASVRLPRSLLIKPGVHRISFCASAVFCILTTISLLSAPLWIFYTGTLQDNRTGGNRAALALPNHGRRGDRAHRRRRGSTGDDRSPDQGHRQRQPADSRKGRGGSRTDKARTALQRVEREPAATAPSDGIVAIASGFHCARNRQPPEGHRDARPE
jgi:hypothetical protein